MGALGRRAEIDASRPLGEELVTSLNCLKDRMLSGPPRCVSGLKGEAFTLFTDACFEAYMILGEPFLTH